MPISATAALTTPYGQFTVHYHEGSAGECLSLVRGLGDEREPLLVRLHSACLFGEAIHDQTCDCGPQLAAALAQIATAERGVLIYLFQEGRGIGIKDKIRVMGLQQREGLNTVEAMEQIGYDADMRSYAMATMALHDLQAPTAIRLMSNNPEKRQALEADGFTIVEVVRLTYDLSAQAHANLHAKVDLMGHSVDFSRLRVEPHGESPGNGTTKQRTVQDESATLAAYITELSDFIFIERGEPYGHMGATITDAILQSGLRYRTQVAPRALHVRVQYPEANTSSGLQQVLAQHTPTAVVRINGRKADWVQQMTDFFVVQAIETEQDLAVWLSDAERAQQLFQVKGVGLKTFNYIKLLVGMRDNVAVDTHIRAFLAAAGVPGTSDQIAGTIVAGAAALLDMSPGQLDRSIWAYGSQRSRDR